MHPAAVAPPGFRSLVPPVYRGSTVLFDKQADASDDWQQGEAGYTYGLYGTPTTLELAARIAELEGSHRTIIVPGGQAAIALIYLSFCTSGTHALVPESAYGPNRELADGLLRQLGIEVEPYDPLLGADIAWKIRAETRLLWCESPGSITMEVQDVPALAHAARRCGVRVAVDNTYSAGVLFDAFGHGADVSIQALTKYVGGHSDILLGSVSARDQDTYVRIGATHRQLGMAVSPDDCSLALRGLQTLGVRLDRLERSTLEVAKWLRGRPEIEQVLHPAFPSCPGHATWVRDFGGSASVFSIILADRYDAGAASRLVDALQLFKLGYSWGGVTSLAMAYPRLERPTASKGRRLVRLNVGLEQVDDLLADLDQALSALPEIGERQNG